MSDVPEPGAAAPSTDYTAILERYAARERLDAELRPANKAAILAALAVGGLCSIVVSFDGCGDSGQIEEIDGFDANGTVPLPPGDVELAAARDDGQIARESIPLETAIERIAYEVLESLYAGWENNDGAFGEVTFDVAAGSIRLDYHGRYVALDSNSHEF